MFVALLLHHIHTTTTIYPPSKCVEKPNVKRLAQIYCTHLLRQNGSRKYQKGAKQGGPI